MKNFLKLNRLRYITIEGTFNLKNSFPKRTFSNFNEKDENLNMLNLSLRNNFNFNNIDKENFQIYKHQKSHKPKFPDKIFEHYYYLDINVNNSNSNKYLEVLSSDLESLNSFQEKIILNNIIENLVLRPEQMKNELYYLSQNPSKFIEILNNSEYLETLLNYKNSNKELKGKSQTSSSLGLGMDLNYKSFVYILRYIKLLYFNFPILIKDVKLMNTLETYLEILSHKDLAVQIIGSDIKYYSPGNQNSYLTILNIGYEISLIIDKFSAEVVKNMPFVEKNDGNISIENKSDKDKKAVHKKKNDHIDSTQKLKFSMEKCLINLFNKDIINLCSNLINVEDPEEINKKEKDKIQNQEKDKLSAILKLTEKDFPKNEENKEKSKRSSDSNTKISSETKVSKEKEKEKPIVIKEKVYLENLDEIYLHNEDNNSLVNFTKLIYILSKIQLSGLLKSDVSSLIYPVNLEKFTKYANEANFSKSKLSTEANIILCNQLKILNFISDKFFVRRIKYDGFDLDKFHIFFNTFLKDKYEHDIDLINLQNNIFSHANSDYFDDPLNAQKFMLMRKTIDWYIKSIGSSIFYHNQSTNVYNKQVVFIRNIIKTLNNSLVSINDPNALFLICYFFANFSANPKSAFEIVHKKQFDIEEINTEILQVFMNAVDHRMKYFLQYDHEAHILNKLKKNHFEPYDKYLDSIIINIAKQFLNKLSQNKMISESLFEIGLKSLKILFELEINDSNYKIDDYIISNMQIFKKKCFLKGAPYLKYIHGENPDIVTNLTKIIPYIKFYDNKYLDEVYKKKNDLIYDDFISNLLVKEYSSVENLIILYNNISEYLIIEDSYKNIKDQKNNFSVNKQFLITCNTIVKKIAPILIKKNQVDNSVLLNSKIDQNLIPLLIINLYNLCLFDKEKNNGIIEIIENYMIFIKGLRNLKGHEIFRLKKEIMNENTIYQILSNLQTILLIKNKENILNKIITPENIRNFTKNIIATINKINLKLKMNLSPLSHLISSVIEAFDHNDIAEILDVFGNRNVENYHPLFTKALLSKFSNSDYLIGLLKKKEVEFFNFAINWPLFIKSSELVKVILNCHESKLLQLDRYEIINILAYNHINHTKLLSFFGESLKKIKRKKKQKEILCEYIFNCTYVNFKVSEGIFNHILDIYEELSTTIYVEPFTNTELCDLVVLSILSSLHNKLSEKYVVIFNHIIDKIKENLSTDLRLKIKNEYIKYYPSIVSEDRYFHKSLTNTKNFTSDWDFDSDSPNSQDNFSRDRESSNFTATDDIDKKSYLRQANDSSYSIDKDFEDFFSKKRDLMYGHQSYIIDDVQYRQILKKWCMAKIFRLEVENETIINQLTHVLVKQQEQNKKSEIYEKLYLKMISFAFHNHHNLFSGYKHPESGLVADYYIKNKDGTKEMFVIYIPKNFTSYEFPENRIIPDGVYQIFITCFKELSKGQILYVFEDELRNYSDKEIEKHILDKISSYI